MNIGGCMDKSIKTTTHSEFFDVVITKTLGVVSGSGVGLNKLASAWSKWVQSSGAEAMEVAKEQALNQIMLSAKDLGANAIIKIRFLLQGGDRRATRIIAYGTAVVVK